MEARDTSNGPERRAEQRHASMMRRFDEQDKRAQERHEQLMQRGRADAQLFTQVLNDIDTSMQRSIERLDDMADAIRANTKAVLSVLDRLEPGGT